jgi:hypothetical protein
MAAREMWRPLSPDQRRKKKMCRWWPNKNGCTTEYLPLAFLAAGSPPSELIDRLMATTAALVATGDKKRRRLPGAPKRSRQIKRQ